MAKLSGFFLSGGDTSVIDTTSAKNTLGVRTWDQAGGEYVYLLGIGSTVAKDFVTFNSASFATTRLAADAMGPVALAMAAVVASNWGWYQIFGPGSGNSDTVAGATASLYIDGTTGRVDDAGVAGDWVEGLFATAADATNVLPVFLKYPGVYNNGYLT